MLITVSSSLPVAPFIALVLLESFALVAANFYRPRLLPALESLLGVTLIFIVLLTYSRSILNPSNSFWQNHSLPVAPFNTLVFLEIVALVAAWRFRRRLIPGLQRLLAVTLVLILFTFTWFTDFPGNLQPSSGFWQDHSLFAGAFASVCLVGSGYLFIDSSLESARRKRDDAVLAELHLIMKVEHLEFFLSGIDLSPESQRRKQMLEDLQYNKEYVLAARSTLRLMTQLTISLLTKEGMAAAPKAVHAFGTINKFVIEYGHAIVLLEAERLGRPGGTQDANDKLLKLQALHSEAHNSYMELIEAAGGKSEIRQAEDEANTR